MKLLKLLKAGLSLLKLCLNYTKHPTRLKLDLIWISVKDRMPVKQGYYLTFYSNGFVLCSFVNVVGDWTIINGKYYGDNKIGNQNLGDVTHWMPLPEPPTAAQPKSCEGCKHEDKYHNDISTNGWCLGCKDFNRYQERTK